jgi:hypothetical protein
VTGQRWCELLDGNSQRDNFSARDAKQAGPGITTTHATVTPDDHGNGKTKFDSTRKYNHEILAPQGRSARV